MKRELGSFERALVISDQHAPFHIVGVLRLEEGPPPHILKQALRVLQKRHPFLQVRLLKERGRYYFATLIEPGLPFRFLPRWNDNHWTEITEVELGSRIDSTLGPLFRCTYLFDANQRHAEIVFAVSHFIMDVPAIGRFMRELLETCASYMSEKTVSIYELPPAPPAESRFPSALRDPRLTLRTLFYTAQQMAEEVFYRMGTRGKRIPLVHPQPAHGHIHSVQLPQDLTELLVQRAGKEGITVNSILNTALMVAVNRELYAGQKAPMRTISFADLRPYIHPPLEEQDLACYVSSLRYTFLVEGGIDFWELARRLHTKITSSLKAGDQFVAESLTESFMKIVTGSQAFRMATTALNYTDGNPIQAEYGKIKVREVHRYTSAYDLGPEFSMQAQLFDGRLCWDFIYLDTDMNQHEAKAVAEEMRAILERECRAAQQDVK